MIRTASEDIVGPPMKYREGSSLESAWPDTFEEEGRSGVPIEETREITDRRWQAVLRLAAVGATAIPRLVEILQDPNPRARIAALNGLRDMRGEAQSSVHAIAAQLSHPYWAVRRMSLAALAMIGPHAAAAVDSLSARIGQEADNTNHGGVLWVLGQIGAASSKAEVVERVAAALAHQEEVVRLNAASTLGTFGPEAERAIPSLLRAFKHDSQQTRIYAARAIGRIRPDDPKATTGLTEVLATISDDSDARREIREIVEDLTGTMPPNPPEPPPRIVGRPWKGLEREDFLLACQPVQSQSRMRDHDTQLQGFLDERLCNAFCFWPDHTWYNLPMPTADQMRRWNMTAIWYFYTENIFNPRQEW